MFGKNTKVSVHDGRMTIMADDARNPGVVNLMLDQVRSGSFETAPAENGGYALVFKPQGRKTADTIAIYNTPDKATRAMKLVFDALSRKSKSSGGFWSGFLKIVLVLLLLLGILFLAGTWVLNSFVSDIAPELLQEAASPQAPADETSLPVGEAFSAETFINATQGVGE